MIRYRIFYIIVCFMFTLSVTGCRKQLTDNVDLDRTELKNYNTPYTYIEQNDDGTYSLFIYASPVQYKEENGEYKKIDNTIIGCNKKNYMFTNAHNSIKTYFPQFLNNYFCIKDESGEEIKFKIFNENVQIEGKEGVYKNLYGDQKNAVIYEVSNELKIYVYPINTGIHFEYILFGDNIYKNLPNLEVLLKNAFMENEIEEYIKFERNNKKDIIIYEPAVMDEKGELFINNKWKSEISDNIIKLKADCKQVENKQSIRLEFSVNVHQEDMPDTGVYEDKKQNIYLSNYSLLGEKTEFGEAWLYQRYRLYYFFSINKSEILEASYNIRNLNYKNEVVEPNIHYVAEQWSSTSMTWKNRPDYISEPLLAIGKNIKNGWISFDMTNYVSNEVGKLKGSNEQFGGMVKVENKKAVLATSDNGEYIPYFKIILKKEPKNFKNHTSINEDYDL